MRDEPLSNDSQPSQKPDADTVVAAAIAAMREDPDASAAADAIEAAWGGRGFDVERAVRGVEAPELTDTTEADEP